MEMFHLLMLGSGVCFISFLIVFIFDIFVFHKNWNTIFRGILRYGIAFVLSISPSIFFIGLVWFFLDKYCR